MPAYRTRFPAAVPPGAWPVRLYFTRPRRTSSMGDNGGLWRTWGNTGRAPPCNCRARLAATMDEPVRALLAVVGDGAVRVVPWGFVTPMMSIPSSYLKMCPEMGRNLFFYPWSAAPAPRARWRSEVFRTHPMVPVHHNMNRYRL